MSSYLRSSLLAIAITTSILATNAVSAANTVAPAGAEGKPIPVSPLKTRAFKGEELLKRAKVSLPEARAIALKAHPGTVTDEELESEKGGSGLRYSFDVKDAKGTHEVGVDAMTGKVLENKLEGLVHD
ncbi:MAG: PepSY domain-containing protein [Pseudomonadota bacterium]